MDNIGGVEERLLSDSEKQEFMDFEEMFRTAGWTKLQQEILQEISETPTRMFWEAKSWEELLIERARLSNLMRLAHFEAVLEQRKEGIVRDRLSQIEEAQAGYGAGE
jgi:chemotaxis methyl-accepting protein methylase